MDRNTRSCHQLQLVLRAATSVVDFLVDAVVVEVVTVVIVIVVMVVAMVDAAMVIVKSVHLVVIVVRMVRVGKKKKLLHVLMRQINGDDEMHHRLSDDQRKCLDDQIMRISGDREVVHHRTVVDSAIESVAHSEAIVMVAVSVDHMVVIAMAIVVMEVIAMVIVVHMAVIVMVVLVVVLIMIVVMIVVVAVSVEMIVIVVEEVDSVNNLVVTLALHI